MNDGQGRGKFFGSPTGLALVAFLGIGGFYLIAEHRAHLVGAAPLLVLLGVCIVMHLFMHGGGGHGRDGSHGGDGDHGGHGGGRAGGASDDPRA